MLGYQERLSKAACPRCKMRGHLSMGPFYDRGRISCAACSHRFRVRVRRCAECKAQMILVKGDTCPICVNRRSKCA